ncbi:MAG: hypothetical protein ABIW03_03645 [Sphingomicrobium sp.]
MRKSGLLLAALTMFGAACKKEPPVLIDGSSQPAFERSASAARLELPNAERPLFDRALRTIGGRRLANRDPAALARVTFDGMTAPEVVADERAHEH